MNSNPTIEEIASHNASFGGHYFDEDTLRFFGQYRRDFKVYRLDDGRIVVYSSAHRKWNSEGLASLAVYNPDTGEISHPKDCDELKVQFQGR